MRKRNKGFARVDRRKKKYGIDEITTELMLERQLHKCAICEKPITIETLVVDHDHHVLDKYDDTVRGLLCNNCNLGLGHFQDKIIVLEAAITYLKRTKKVLD